MPEEAHIARIDSPRAIRPHISVATSGLNLIPGALFFVIIIIPQRGFRPRALFLRFAGSRSPFLL